MHPVRLNPADHFTLMMDREIRAAGLAGNFCGVVLELQGIPEADFIEQQCRNFATAFPRAVARLRRQGRQYAWHLEAAASLPFFRHTLADGAGQADRERVVLDVLNRPTPVPAAAPVELHLVESDGTSALLLRWFHPLFDAKGAELLLHHLFQTEASAPAQAPSAVEEALDKWRVRDKARLAYRAFRNIRELDKQSSILPVVSRSAARRFGMRLVSLERSQSEQVIAEAIRETGMTGISLYFIGCLMRALLRSGCSEDGDAFCVPYAMNLRKSKALHPVFGNQVSFLFAQASRQQLASRETLFAHLRAQNKQAVRTQQDRAMLPLMQLGSWLELDKYARIVRTSPHHRERSSAWFSFTGDMYPEPKQIAGCAVTGLYQLSPVTRPPALGLLVSRFDGRLKLSYNYIDGCFSEEWLDRLTRTVTAELLGQDEHP